MAVSYVWPGALPQYVHTDYAENSGVMLLSTPMDAGPAKLRRRGARPDRLTVSFTMDNAQLDTLRTFVQDTLRGTARFGFPHPRTRQQVEVRLVPSDGGQLYAVTWLSPIKYAVSMTLEVLP